MSENWELLESRNGVRTYIGTGSEDDTVLVRRDFDHAATKQILDRNKALQSEDFDRRSEMWHAASVPVHVMYEWLTKHGVNAWNPAHSDAVKKLLNSNEYRWCKVKNIIL